MCNRKVKYLSFSLFCFLILFFVQQRTYDNKKDRILLTSGCSDFLGLDCQVSQTVKNTSQSKVLALTRIDYQRNQLLENTSISAATVTERLTDRPRNSVPGVNKILLFTSYRSGSTFTGEIFQRNPFAFYVFEPLRFLNFGNSISQISYIQGNIVKYLNDCFSCNFSNLIKDSQKLFPQFIQKRNHWLNRAFRQTYIKLKPETVDLQRIALECRRITTRVIKIIRGKTLKSIFPLMNSSAVKVIHLVRDPRAMALSRFEIKMNTYQRVSNNINRYLLLPEYQKFIISSMREICCQYSENINLILGLLNTTETATVSLFEKFYALIRYEDLAFNPIEFAKKIYNFTNLSWDKFVEKWILASTKMDDNLKGLSHVYGTTRNSSATAEAWHKKIPFSVLKKLQEICLKCDSNILQHLGYKVFETEEEYVNFSSGSTDIPPKVPFTIH